MGASKGVDWESFKTRYIMGTMTQKELADEAGPKVTYDHLRTIATREKWGAQRKEYRADILSAKLNAGLENAAEAVKALNDTQYTESQHVLILLQTLREKKGNGWSVRDLDNYRQAIGGTLEMAREAIGSVKVETPLILAYAPGMVSSESLRKAAKVMGLDPEEFMAVTREQTKRDAS
jgi:beta-mannanase